MKNLLFLIGPTFMIFIGLTYFESVPITFALFYGWLFVIPFATYLREPQLKKALIQSLKKGFTLNSVLFGLVSGLVSLIAVFGAVSLLQGYLFEIDQLKALLEEWNFSGSSVWGLILILLVINPFLEEWYWRDFMHVRLLHILGGTRTVFITSFFYALYHLLSLIPMFALPFNIIAAIPVFAAGLLWGYFRIRFGTMVAALISHVLADLGIMLVYLYYFI